MSFIVSMFSTYSFDCGYSSNDVLLKSHTAVNCIYSTDAKHGALPKNTSFE